MTWADSLRKPSASHIARLYPHMGVEAPTNDTADDECPILELPEKLGFLVTEHHRYKGARGGRGGVKSWSFARALLLLAAMKKIRVLCARELQVSITESVHKLLADQIYSRPWYAERFEVQKTAIYSHTGSEFIFTGIRNNITKVKSMEGIDICWVEEAEKVTDNSWQVLIPTIRKPGSEIWISFNPDLEEDPTSRRFITTQPPRSKIVEIGWQDNPWLPEELREEKDYLYKIDPEAADHVWGGQFRKNSAAQVLRGKYVVDFFVPEPDWAGPYYGVDWGFSVDPTTMVKVFIHKNVLYIYEEAYGVGVDIDKTPELFDTVRGARKAYIRADSARPETISYLQRHGYENMIGVIKWAGSVEDGVAFLRSFEKIVIHTSCKHAEQEAKLWSYKVDKLTKEPLVELDDKHNHIWDAVRYALEPLIRQAQRGMLDFMKEMKRQQPKAVEESAPPEPPKRNGPWR